jgi:hypothetical protein
MSTLPDTTPATAVHQLVELVGALASEVRELRAELAGTRGTSPWMTSEEAAAYLKVSRDTLDKYIASHGHEEGGPVNVGEARKVLRWNRETIDAWFRRAAGIAAPKPARRASPRAVPRPVVAGRFDWSKV